MDTLAFKADRVADHPMAATPSPPASDTAAITRPSLARPSISALIVKNILVAVVLIGGWFALDTGYLGTDRIVRSQWERFEKRAKLAPDAVVYQADFSTIKPDQAAGAGVWSRYNLATPETTEFDATGITVNYKNAAWLGAAFSLASYVPDRIYRVTFDIEVEGQPAAVIVRNRQMDIERESIPVGKSKQVLHFFSPSGRRNQTHVIFMPDYAADPEGKLKLTSFKIELLKE